MVGEEKEEGIYDLLPKTCFKLNMLIGCAR